MSALYYFIVFFGGVLCVLVALHFLAHWRLKRRLRQADEAEPH